MRALLRLVVRSNVENLAKGFNRTGVELRTGVGFDVGEGLVVRLTRAVGPVRGDRIVGVTDGDTIKLLDSNNVEYKIRLTGIDAPERGQPFGTASTKHLASMVVGKEVFVESSKQDRYGRTLGKVWVRPSDCPSCGKIFPKTGRIYDLRVVGAPAG